MALQTAIGRVRGLGSAREGVGHWKAQRLTAIANLFLMLWFVFAIASLADTDYATVRSWLASPVSATLMVLFVISVFHHARLGVQVVIEDYVHHEGIKIVSLALLALATFGLAVACIVAVLSVSFGT